MGMPPFRRDFVATDKHYVTNYGLTCVGLLIVVLVLGFIGTGFITTIQSMISGNAIDPLLLITQLVFLIGALIILVFLVKMHLNRRNKGMLDDDIE